MIYIYIYAYIHYMNHYNINHYMILNTIYILFIIVKRELDG